MDVRFLFALIAEMLNSIPPYMVTHLIVYIQTRMKNKRRTPSDKG